MQVPLLDLKVQYNTLKKELDEALLKVSESQSFILGPYVADLEANMNKFLGVKHSIGVSSGTDALLIALMAIDIKPGDEVIVPTYSFFATAGVVSRLNAVPIFTDIDPVTFNVSPADIEKRITEKTKAIIPVHLYGQSADMEQIMEIAGKYNLKVIEDGAQSISAQYKDGRGTGTIGNIGCYSFFPSKNLGCFGDGGLVVTNDDELGERLKILRVHGGKPKYYHKTIGGNFRLDAIQAAVLNVKLPHLDNWSEGRRRNAELYTKLFCEAGLAEETGKTVVDDKNSVLLPKPVYKNINGLKNYHIYNQYVIRVENRDGLLKYLKENNIGCEIYYPVPFHKQVCFQYLMDNPVYKMKAGDYPESDYAAEHSLALPVYPELSEDQINHVVNTILNYFIN